MPLGTLGLILYVASHSLQRCENVFVDLAHISNPTQKSKTEQVYLEEFAKAACETSNPDAIWLLAKQESNFRFLIVRENAKKPIIREGQDAINFLARMKHNPTELRHKSIDIGVLQFNWRWHKAAFNDDPLMALSPRLQFEYFLNSYSGEIFKRCDSRWVGCYHNQVDQDSASRYQDSVQKRNEKFTMLALYYLRDRRQALAKQDVSGLPIIKKDEFYRVFEISKSFPLPKKLLESFSADRNASSNKLLGSKTRS